MKLKQTLTQKGQRAGSEKTRSNAFKVSVLKHIADGKSSKEALKAAAADHQQTLSPSMEKHAASFVWQYRKQIERGLENGSPKIEALVSAAGLNEVPPAEPTEPAESDDPADPETES